MNADIDMNHNRIKNLAAPINANDALRLADIASYLQPPGISYASLLLSTAGGSYIGFKMNSSDAIDTTILEKLRRIEVHVEDFGAVPNDVTKAAANYTAIRKALKYILTQAPAPYLEAHLTLTFGTGEYFITGNSPLMFNRTEMLAIAGAYRYRRGIGFKGQGKLSTILSLVSAGTGDLWFYSTADANYPGDTSVADQMHFDGITFRGTQSAVTQATGHKTNGFYLETYGWEKFITWTNCSFDYLDKAIDVEGYGNGDHNRLIATTFTFIRDYCLRLNNNQSLAWGLYGCDAESILGDVIQVGPQGGGDLVWIGGSIVLYPEVDISDVPLVSQRQKAFIKWDNSGVLSGPTTGPSNNKFSFHQLRFETYDGSQAMVYTSRSDATSYGSIDITFTDCTASIVALYGTGTIPSVDWPALDVENETRVRFVRTVFTHVYTFTLRKHLPNVTFEDCQWLDEGLSTTTNTEGLGGRCTIVAGCEGYIKARNISTRRNVSFGDFSKVIIGDFNKGTQGNTMPFFSAQGKDILMPWPQPNAAGPLSVYFVAGTIVNGFMIDRPAEVVASPTTNFAFSIKDHSGNVLGAATTAQSQSLGVLARQTLAAPHRIPAAPNNYIQIAASGDSVTTPWVGKTGGVYLELA